MSQNDVKKNEFDAFLTDEEEIDENVEYIKPDIELKLPANRRNECREIVKEVKEFGVRSQRQILYLIYLLALELDNIQTMRAITNACKEGRKELQDDKKLILDE